MKLTKRERSAMMDEITEHMCEYTDPEDLKRELQEIWKFGTSFPPLARRTDDELIQAFADEFNADDPTDLVDVLQMTTTKTKARKIAKQFYKEH